MAVDYSVILSNDVEWKRLEKENQDATLSEICSGENAQNTLLTDKPWIRLQSNTLIDLFFDNLEEVHADAIKERLRMGNGLWAAQAYVASWLIETYNEWGDNQNIVSKFLLIKKLVRETSITIIKQLHEHEVFKGQD